MERRAFLAALLAAGSWPVWGRAATRDHRSPGPEWSHSAATEGPSWGLVSANELKMLEVDCPERAFDETRRALSRMGSSDDFSDQEFINGARGWAGGPDLDRSGLQWRFANGVPVKVFGSGSGGVVMHMHGGGWVCGNAQSDHNLCDELAARAGMTVVSVDYRLAPEHPFPIPIEDCLSVARWLIANSGKEFGSDRLFITGCSAGAHLAAMTLLGLGPQALRFGATALYYGVFDLGLTPAARMARDEEHPDLSTTSLARMIDWFTPRLRREQRQVASISPLYAPVPELPDTLFLVGGADILTDDTLQLARRWAERNTVHLALYPGAPHGFNAYDVAGVEDSLDRVVDFLTSR